MQVSLSVSWCSSAFWMRWRRTRQPWRRNSKWLRDCWLEAGRRRLQKREPDVAAAQADVDAAQANLTNAELLYHRQEALASKQYVSLQIRDDAQRSYLGCAGRPGGQAAGASRQEASLAARRHRAAQRRHCRGPGHCSKPTKRRWLWHKNSWPTHSSMPPPMASFRAGFLNPAIWPLRRHLCLLSLSTTHSGCVPICQSRRWAKSPSA